ncbi:hypothetical protein [Motiliproteus sp. MSK22-1]|uniref:hypothetical protein n=1 Tax=Motiliproteus sp. MSK22-1 TaxID=1897630 RepID=UPI0009779375|nr:hypothetical protein [Motiliproteus sp. MSK22-1]OMH32766.1 hypothetical protein BGP75_14675 [Motiliproteus sp. MSK22-1]
MPIPSVPETPTKTLLVKEWEQRSITFEVVACSELWDHLPPDLHQQIQHAIQRPLEADQEVLFISFDGLMDKRYSAFLLTEYEQAALFYEKDGDVTNDFIGLLSPLKLWEFLESFPNIYRHLS